MRIIIIAIVTISLFSCNVEPTELENEVNCIPASFVGQWEYQSTNGVELDSIPDIEIQLSDDEMRGELLIDGRYSNVKSVTGCTSGDISGLLDVVYELKSIDELYKRTTAFVLFGSTSVYKRE